MSGHSLYSHSVGLFLLHICYKISFATICPPKFCIPCFASLHGRILIKSCKILYLVYLVSVMYLCKCKCVLMWWAILPHTVFSLYFLILFWKQFNPYTLQGRLLKQIWILPHYHSLTLIQSVLSHLVKHLQTILVAFLQSNFLKDEKKFIKFFITKQKLM